LAIDNDIELLAITLSLIAATNIADELMPFSAYQPPHFSAASARLSAITHWLIAIDACHSHLATTHCIMPPSSQLIRRHATPCAALSRAT